ncbi:nucleoside deaminase [bacterium]|nr:nucleoside deaminase [bacterium]
MGANSKITETLLKLAKENATSTQGGPFAAIIVKDGQIIAQATNQVLGTNDPTAHAEVQAIRLACKKVNSFQLDGCILYTSCEPCPMCLGAIYWARPDKVFYVATRNEAAKGGFDDEFIYQELTIPIHERKIAFEKIDSPNSFDPFEVWLKNTSRTAY